MLHLIPIEVKKTKINNFNFVIEKRIKIFSTIRNITEDGQVNKYQ